MPGRSRGARRGPVARALVLAGIAALVLPPAAGAQVELAPVPGVDPPQANDPSCVPREDRPPVVLVHGTLLDMTSSWPALAPQLARDGFCVFALDYGRRGTAPVDASADELAAFTRRVLDATGASRVSFVGHSQGGLLARWTTRSRGLLDVTEDIVGLAPSHHGTTQPAAPLVAQLGCLSCADQQAGSAFLALANADPEAPPEVDHTVITTRYDEVVTPPSSQALRGPTVGNVVLQDQCPGDLAEHVGIVVDPVALSWVRHALLRDGPADPLARADCTGARLPAERPSPPRPPSSRPPGAGGNGTTGGSGSPLRLVLRSTALRATRTGRVAVRVRCEGPAGERCESLVRLRHRDAVLGTVRASVPAGRNATLTVALTRAGRRLAARREGVRVVLRATTSAGTPRSARRTVTLRGA